jgi:hypothetical protein
MLQAPNIHCSGCPTLPILKGGSLDSTSSITEAKTCSLLRFRACKSSSFAVPRSDNVSTGHAMKLNRTQVIGTLLLAALVLLGLLLRYWKFSG